jgi:hypothetical protein
MTVRQLLSTVDSRELSEWIAYFNLEKGPTDTQLSNTEKIKAFFARKMKRKS